MQIGQESIEVSDGPGGGSPTLTGRTDSSAGRSPRLSGRGIDPSWAHRPSARSRAGGAFPIAVAIVSTLCP